VQHSGRGQELAKLADRDARLDGVLEVLLDFACVGELVMDLVGDEGPERKGEGADEESQPQRQAIGVHQDADIDVTAGALQEHPLRPGRPGAHRDRVRGVGRVELEDEPRRLVAGLFVELGGDAERHLGEPQRRLGAGELLDRPLVPFLVDQQGEGVAPA
jgi:hypothetical protein